MRSEASGALPYAAEGGTLTLAAPALAELLGAVLERGVRFRFRARGTSMSPLIRDGDVLTLRPLSGAPPRLGEIVAFTRPGTKGLVIHRVVGRNGGMYLTRGDGSPCPDRPVAPSHILGRVAGVERNGKTVRFGLGPERALIALATSRALARPWFRALAVARRALRGGRR